AALLSAPSRRHGGTPTNDGAHAAATETVAFAGGTRAVAFYPGHGSTRDGGALGGELGNGCRDPACDVNRLCRKFGMAVRRTAQDSEGPKVENHTEKMAWSVSAIPAHVQRRQSYRGRGFGRPFSEPRRQC